MKNLSPDALAWLKRLRDSSSAGVPPPHIAAALKSSGVARAVAHGNFMITNKGREGLRAMLPKPYAPPKRFL